jgi:hypothetical protein
VIVGGLVLIVVLKVVRWYLIALDMGTVLRGNVSVRMDGRVIFAMLRLLALLTVTTGVFVLRVFVIVGVVMVACLVSLKSAPTNVLDTVRVSRQRREHLVPPCSALVTVAGLDLTALCLIVPMLVQTMEFVIMVPVIVTALSRVMIVPSMLNLVPIIALDMVCVLRSLVSVCAVVIGMVRPALNGCMPLMVPWLTHVARTVLVWVCVYMLTMVPHHITVSAHLTPLALHVRALAKLGVVVMVDVSAGLVVVMMVGQVIVVSGNYVHQIVMTMVIAVMVYVCARRVMLVKLAPCLLKKLCRISV